MRRRLVPCQRHRGLAVEAADPAEFLDLEARAGRIGQLGEQHAALDQRHGGAVLGRAAEQEIGAGHAAGGRHVLHDDGRIAGDVLGEMPRRGARLQVVAAADAGADDEGDLLAGVEILCAPAEPRAAHGDHNGWPTRRGADCGNVPGHVRVSENRVIYNHRRDDLQPAAVRDAARPNGFGCDVLPQAALGLIGRAMARRFIIEQGTSRLAIWARRLAFFSLAAALLSVIIVHSGIMEMRPALATFGAALALAVLALLLGLRRLRVDLAGRQHRHRCLACRHRHCAAAAGLSLLSRGQGARSCRGSTTSPPTRSIRRATTRSPRRGRATPIPSSMPACRPPSSSARPIPTSSRWNPTSTCASPTAPRTWSSPSGAGASSRRARRIRAAARDASRRWRGRRSWAFATTSWCACAPSRAARASTCARRRATASSILAPMPPACAACSKTSSTRSRISGRRNPSRRRSSARSKPKAAEGRRPRCSRRPQPKTQPKTGQPTANR